MVVDRPWHAPTAHREVARKPFFLQRTDIYLINVMLFFPDFNSRSIAVDLFL